MRRLWLEIKWMFGIRARFYNEAGLGFTPENLALDSIARKVSRGRYGFGAVHLKEHKCGVCGVEFYTERENEPICRRRRCYIEYYKSEAFRRSYLSKQ